MERSLEITFVRHLESSANRAGVLAGSCDVALVPSAGRGLTQQLVELPKPSLILSSDLNRAAQTAREAAKILGVTSQIVYSPLLRERCFGSLEMGPKKSTLDELRSLGATRAPLGGESMVEVSERVITTMLDIDINSDTNRVLVVSHSGAFRALWSALDGAPYSRWFDATGLRNGDFVRRVVSRRQLERAIVRFGKGK